MTFDLVFSTMNHLDSIWVKFLGQVLRSVS